LVQCRTPAQEPKQEHPGYHRSHRHHRQQDRHSQDDRNKATITGRGVILKILQAPLQSGPAGLKFPTRITWKFHFSQQRVFAVTSPEIDFPQITHDCA
jgi:hypothetical protein